MTFSCPSIVQVIFGVGSPMTKHEILPFAPSVILRSLEMLEMDGATAKAKQNEKCLVFRQFQILVRCFAWSLNFGTSIVLRPVVIPFSRRQYVCVFI